MVFEILTFTKSPRLKACARTRLRLSRQARITVKQGMWGLSAAVVSGAGGYWYLSYVYLSWDIMVRGRLSAWHDRALSCRV